MHGLMRNIITGLLLMLMSPVGWGEDLYIRCVTSLDLMTRGTPDEESFSIRRWRLPVFFSLAGDDPVIRVGDSRRNIGKQVVLGVRVTKDSETALEGTMYLNYDRLGSWAITKPELQLDMEWFGPWGHVKDSIGNLYRPNVAYGTGKCQEQDSF